jgi:hypothetical protein
MLRKQTGRAGPPEEPSAPPVRWYTVVTVYRDPASSSSTVRTAKTLKARSLREATLLYLAETESGPPQLAHVDLTSWSQVRMDVSETGEDALEEPERQRVGRACDRWRGRPVVCGRATSATACPAWFSAAAGWSLLSPGQGT